MRPTDDQLRRFLNGSLPPDEAETVGRWVESAPDAADALALLDRPDTLAAALARGGGTPFPHGPDVAAQLERLGEAVGGPDGTPAISGYEITGELARGGMGRVYAARDLRLDREVAIKTLLPGADPARFVTESKITARLPHPGIPPVHALGLLADGTPYLAMKLVRGRTLEAWLTSRPSPSDDRPALVQVFEQIAQAVGFAHAQGVIHRDLKPLNMMVGAFGEVQVMDWGLAKVLAPLSPGGRRVGGEGDEGSSSPADVSAEHTHAGTVMGTPGYMAPEQARGEAVDARADVFALGAMLAAILTGRPAFVAETGREAVAMAAAGELDPAFARLDASGADAELVALAKRCLAAGAAARPVNGREVAAEVGAYRAGVEARLRRAETSAAEATVREAEGWKRRRVLLVAAGALVVVLAGGVIGTTNGLLQAQEAKEAEGLRANGEREAKEDAIRQQAKAEQAEEDALAALRAGTDDAIEKLIGSKSKLGPQEREYLEATRKRWQAFADRKGDDERSRAIRSEGHIRVGFLYEKLWQRAAAETEFRQALTIRRALANDFPHRENYRHLLAVAHNHLGNLLSELGDQVGAEYHLRSAMPLFDQLVSDKPTSAIYREDSAHGHYDLGHLMLDLGRLSTAEDEHKLALVIRRKLAADFPNASKYKAEEAQSLRALATLSTKLQRSDVEELLREAISIQNRVVDEIPTATDHRTNLAGYHLDLGSMLIDVGQMKKAEGELRNALTILEKIAVEYPAVPVYRSGVANVLNAIGILHSDIGDHATAEKELSRAVEIVERLIQDDPKVPEYYRMLGNELTNRSRARVSLSSSAGAIRDIALAANAQAMALRLDPDGTSEFFRDSAVQMKGRKGIAPLPKPSTREVLPPPKMVKE